MTGAFSSVTTLYPHPGRTALLKINARNGARSASKLLKTEPVAD